jgi:hypothetical protein
MENRVILLETILYTVTKGAPFTKPARDSRFDYVLANKTINLIN